MSSTVVIKNGMELTADEEKLYDRQIRLWGFESQKKLRAARVLVVGINGLGAEVVKNIILAGINSLTMLDSSAVSELDLHSQFLAPPDGIGKNKAEASVARAQKLNPLVKVEADTEHFDLKSDEYFKPWEVIVATGLTPRQAFRLSRLCRQNSVKLFIGDVFGTFGYAFEDLQCHTFVHEVTSRVRIEGNDPEEKPRFEDKVTRTMREEKFPSYEDGFDVELVSEEGVKLGKGLPSEFIALKVLHEFRAKKGRDPQPRHCIDDTKELQEILKLEVPDEETRAKVPPELFSYAFSQISPVCAIVGGVLAQELIKAVSEKGQPMNNTFFYNPISNIGYVTCFGV